MTTAQRTQKAAVRGLRPKRRPLRTFLTNWELLALCLPAVTLYILFHYVPMAGIVMAFKNFKYNLGLFGSPWNGLRNFEFLFRSVSLFQIVRNTVGYNLVFLVLGPVINIAIALLLFEIQSRRALKAYQTVMTFPNFMSWVIVGYITYAIFNPSLGLLNQVLGTLGAPPVDVYTKVGYWPFIIVIVNLWKGLGMGSMVYFAALMGIDPSLYEAAIIDGANRRQQTRYISIPSLMPLVAIMSIMAIGGIFGGDFGLFYQIPRNVSALYPATDIIDTFVYRGLKNANFGNSSAVGLIQSLVGLVFVGLTNAIVAKISPDNAMF